MTPAFHASSSSIRAARRDAGAALFVAMVSLVVVTALATAMLSAVDSERAGVVIEADRLQAVKLAEGALEVAEAAFLDRIASYRPMPDPPVDDVHRVLDGSFDVGYRNVTWVIRQATTVDKDGVETVVPTSNSIDPDTGLQLTIEPYVIETSVAIGTSTVRMRRHVEIQKVPIFQFLAYYAGDLEILPGPAMTLNGRIHSNADLYMTAGNSLDVSTKYVRTANEFFRRRKDGGAAANGSIRILDSASNGLVLLPSRPDLASQGIDSLNGLDSLFTGWDVDGDGSFDEDGEMPPFKNAATDLFGGTLQTGEHGVKPLQPPDVASIQAYVAAEGGDYVETSPGTFAPVDPGTGTHEKSHFHANADLVVIDDQVFDRTGQNITASMPAGFVETKSVWDQRENRTVTCTQINVGKLGDMDGDPSTYDPCPYYPDNGLLFAARSESAAGAGGVVLTNGRELNVPARWNIGNYAPEVAVLDDEGIGPIPVNPSPIVGVGNTLGAVLPGAAPAGAVAFGNSEVVGLTVVSPVPVYVHGDYNTVAKKPAAVISSATRGTSRRAPVRSRPRAARRTTSP
jgi:hypothetical protein